MNHLLEVAALVAEADEGNTDLIVAALLHDAIEDQKIPLETITTQFGERVAGLVQEATDDKSLPKPERKRLQIETAPKKALASSRRRGHRGRRVRYRERKASRLHEIPVRPANGSRHHLQIPGSRGASQGRPR